MIRQLLSALLMAICCAFFAASAAAQETGASAPAADRAVPSAEDTFERIARRAEELAANEEASPFAITRLRAELVTWRDFFLEQANANAGRLATINDQITALGPVPDSGEEPQAVAERRAVLLDQRANLIAPRLLAEESRARAEGLIREFDARVLQDEADALTARGPSPLSPSAGAEAVTSVVTLFGIIATELSVGVAARFQSGALGGVLPRALAILAVGALLLSVVRGLVTRWRSTMSDRRGRWWPLVRFVVSFIQILVPLLGLLAVAEALELLGVFGLRGADMVAAIPEAGFCAIFGWWVARHVFPEGRFAGYLNYPEDTRRSGRRYTMAIAWVSTLAVLISAGLRTVEISAQGVAATQFPVLVLLGVLLWRLGRVIAVPPEHDGNEQDPTGGRTRALIGRYATIVAVGAPVLAALGYGFAGASLMSASLQSLGLVAVVFLMQRILHDLLEVPPDDGDYRGIFALLPVFASGALFLVSAPIFALIWGARVDDLLELWSRFREGFAIGETRLSPTDFLAFVLVFAFGYVLTRFVQGLLRKSVLPRTRLDLGAQNAVVAGFGYVGIILAAIFAITTAGLDLSNLAIVAGALSVGIGFGLQNIVSNFVSGIILLIERPVSEGDWIEVAGQMGYVRAISVRSTRIETFDRRDVIIPNADLVSGQVTNWTRGNLVGRVIVPVGVAYGTDVDQVTTILQDIAERHPMVVMDPPPAVIFQGFGADSLDFEIRAILRDVNYVLSVKSEMNHEIAKKFAEASIEIPFAQRDIWLRNPEVLKGDAQ